MIPRAVHQFAPTYSAADGIGNGMRLIRRLLRAAGVPSEIYALEARLPDGMPWSAYAGAAEQVLLIHHGIGNPAEAALRALPDRRFLVFHNITPAHFFAADDPIHPLLRQGWEQLTAWRAWLDGAIADSAQNLSLLLDHGYAPERCAAIPLLVDLDQYGPPRPEHACRPLDDGLRLLFVGRLMPHKNQLGLIHMLYHLRRMTGIDARLTLVGTTCDQAYRTLIEQTIAEYGLETAVTLAGRLVPAALERAYRHADLYVSLSRHEGFGMPLIEALAHRLPVLAYCAPESNVAHTLGPAGLLLDQDDPLVCAAALEQLIIQPRLRARLLRHAEQHLRPLAPAALYQQLSAFFARCAIELPALPAHDSAPPAPLRYRIEGPCADSYSLAIVNRRLAKALARRYPGDIGLYPTEGPGDLTLAPAVLARDPDLAALVARAHEVSTAEVCCRLLYPPRVTAMPGRVNMLSCYGWEESVLPAATVEHFNHHLHGATLMSHYVAKVWIDNGVTVPYAVVGLGVEGEEPAVTEAWSSHHLPSAVPRQDGRPIALPTTGLRLLHISSGFPRKGIDVLLQAYGMAFSAADDVTLLIKTFPNPHQNVAGQLAEWRARHPQPPPVLVIEDELDESALAALYRAAQVLVAPSRGEGFGLPLAEAMRARVPVIATGYGGQSDFCTAETAWLIDWRFARAQTHIGVSDSVWVEPDVAHLASLLGEFYRHYRAGTLAAFTADKVARAERLIAQDFTWPAVVTRTEAFLQQLSHWPDLLPTLALGCVTTWNSPCGIASYSAQLLTPAVPEALILANDNAERTAPDSARVIRCWQAGQDDDLTRLEQTINAAGLTQVLIQFNFSFFALPALQRLLGALHARGIQTLLTLHSTADVYWGAELKTLRALLPALHQCTRILVHGIADLNRLKDWGLINNTLLWPHGVARDTAASSLPAAALGALAGRRIIASYGFLLPHKGIVTLIEACAQLRARLPNIHLLLLNAAYPAPQSQATLLACQEAIHHHGLAEQVTLITDYLPEAVSLAWLKQAELIVFPYQHTQESSSAAVRWGLASGRPVVCTPLAIFDDVAAAVHFLPGTDAAAIAAELERLLRQPALLEDLGPRQARWLDDHDWTHISRRLRNLCLALAQQRSAGQRL